MGVKGLRVNTNRLRAMLVVQRGKFSMIFELLFTLISWEFVWICLLTTKWWDDCLIEHEKLIFSWNFKSRSTWRRLLELVVKKI
jgi:hypothetical protein